MRRSNEINSAACLEVGEAEGFSVLRVEDVNTCS